VFSHFEKRRRKMASVTRTNPTAIARGTIQKTRELNMMKVVLAGGNGLGAIGTDALAAKVTDACGSFAGLFQVKSDGSEIYMVVDNHGVDIDAVATTVAQVLDTGSFTVSGGVATLSDTDTVTVTVVTDIEAI
jgi:hypothetical protein